MTPMTPGNRRVSIASQPEALETARPSAPPPAAPGPTQGALRAARVLGVLRTVAGLALVAGTSLGVAWVARKHVTTSPRFAITSIDVAGNEQRTADAVVAESGLEVGGNVFAADLDAAQARILADPWIATAALSRRLPGTVVIHVTERKAAALVALGDTYVATSQGEPFKKLGPDDASDALLGLPVVTGLRPESIADDRDGTTQTIRRAIDLAAEYDRTPLAKRAPLEEVHVEPDGVFSLVVGKSGVVLELGVPPFRRKLDQAARVVAELDRRGGRADAIMLDNDTRPDRVVVRMR